MKPATLSSCVRREHSHHPPYSHDKSKSKSKSSAERTSTMPGSRIQKRQTDKGNRANKTIKGNNNKTAASPVQVTTASAPLIRVSINNRLGTRTEIPCSPSDTIGAFKRLAAVYLGTRPEAMMLKRQGERPFRDSLTLEDYEVHDGTCLDLEIDTSGS